MHPSWTPWSVVIAALEARVREDLTTLPEESGSWERHAEEYPSSPLGHLRSLRGVIVRVTGDLDEGRIGGFERQHATLSDLGDARACSKGQLLGLSDPDARPDVHWFRCRSFSSHRMAQGSGRARDSKVATREMGPCSGCSSPALDQRSLR